MSVSDRLWGDICGDTSAPRYRFGTQRSASPTETLRRIAPLLPWAGITRLADVTGLDWLGIPVYQAIRPNSRNISVALGKGLTRPQAKASALMESLESFHAERLPHPSTRATIASMRRQLPYDPYALPVASAAAGGLRRDLAYDPYALPVGEPTLLHDSTPLDWVPATDLWTGASTWIPRQLCELDFCLDERLCPPMFRASSNGLASGNTTVEAVLHGLCEVIERDGMWRLRDATSDPDRSVAPTSIDSKLCRNILDRFERNGLRPQVVDSTGPTMVPCFQVFLSSQGGPSGYLGAGCHPSRTTALLRALTEVAQSRLGHIAGSRDDLVRRTYAGSSAVPAAAPAPLPVRAGRAFRDVPTQPVRTWAASVCEVVGRVRAVTGMAPLVVDLTRPNVGLPVVFVVSPGLHLLPPKRR